MIARPLLAAALTASLGASLALGMPALTTSASAHPARVQRAGAEPTDELATDLLSPLSLASGPDGTLWFTQDLRGALDKLVPGQPATRVYQAHGHLEVGGVSVSGARTYFTLSGKQETFGKLMSIGSSGGTAKVVADFGAYERAHNPDGAQRYGFRHLSPSCNARISGAASYTGKEQTHPYATLQQGKLTYVADAAANAIFKVRGHGKISTVAVLPSVSTTVTQAFAKQSKLPGCTVGKAYRAEPVPTDVVAGPSGTLYVTSLPGGPAGLGGEARGAVWQVDIKSGKLTQVVGGLDTPTGLTVAPNGDIYVAELFAGQIVRIPAGSGDVVPFAAPGFPGDVLATPAGLVATTNVLSGTSGKAGDPVNGTVVRYAYP